MKEMAKGVCGSNLGFEAAEMLWMADFLPELQIVFTRKGCAAEERNMVRSPRETGGQGQTVRFRDPCVV